MRRQDQPSLCAKLFQNSRTDSDVSAEAFAEVPSEFNWFAVPRIINQRPTRRERMSGTPQHQRLKAHISQLPEGESGP